MIREVCSDPDCNDNSDHAIHGLQLKDREIERLQARVKELETGIRKFLDPTGPEAFGLERLPFDPDDYPLF